MWGARRARGITAEPDVGEAHRERVDQENPADQRLTDTEDQLERLDGPKKGDAIFFTYKTDWGEDRQLITSKIEDVARTPRKDVLAYNTLKRPAPTPPAS